MTKDHKNKSGSAKRRREVTQGALPPNPANPELLAMGRIVTTDRARRKICKYFRLAALLNYRWRHWGDIRKEDRALNEAAPASGVRISTVYHDDEGNAFSITTEADRSMTTIDLVDDE